MNKTVESTKKITRAQKYVACKEERTRLIEHYKSVDYNQSPTPMVDSGAHGKLVELQFTRENSLKHKVSAVGQADNYFKLNGKAKTYECKTNGGRVGSIIKSLETGYDGFVVYELNINNAGTSHKLRYVPAVIMHCSQFIQLLEDTKSLRLNSRDDEPCIQPTSKKLYLRLLDYPIPFNPNEHYTSEDFEGLEI